MSTWRILHHLEGVPDASTHSAHGKGTTNIIDDAAGAGLALVLHAHAIG